VPRDTRESVASQSPLVSHGVCVSRSRRLVVLSLARVITGSPFIGDNARKNAVSWKITIAR